MSEAQVVAETAEGQRVHELRVALTVDDLDEAITFYSHRLGLEPVLSWDEPTGRGVVLGAGRGTLELVDAAQAAHIDDVEVGRRTAGPVRIAIEVDDADTTTRRLAASGAAVLGGPVTTPWGDRNARLAPPGPVQLTLFSLPAPARVAAARRSAAS